jgi:hypothetical protein
MGRGWPRRGGPGGGRHRPGGAAASGLRASGAAVAPASRGVRGEPGGSSGSCAGQGYWPAGEAGGITPCTSNGRAAEPLLHAPKTGWHRSFFMRRNVQVHGRCFRYHRVPPSRP